MTRSASVDCDLQETSKWPRLWVAIVIAVTSFGCSRTPLPEPTKAAPVRIAVAESGPGFPALSVTGILSNKDEARLSFKVAGVIKRIAVRPGEHVRKGQRLAEIELAEIQAQVAQARDLAEQASRDLARGERLYTEQVIPLEQLQQLRTQASVANARLAAIRFNEDYSTIIAPQEGTILQKLAEERELASAGQPILVLGGYEQGFVLRAGLADRDVVRIRLQDPARIEIDAFPGKVFNGIVNEIGSAADQGSGLFPMEVKIVDTIPALVSGLVARVTVNTHAATQASLLYVPIGAILEGDKDRASVFVVEGDIARRRAVRIAFIDAERVAIAEGLREGERVVTDGALYLDDSAQVTFQPASGTVPAVQSKRSVQAP